ncbi:unnamed protein product [Ectocarpus sp. CCAP 1310/34]|nr:unnamed protein product [Ectocarpus sp. CCAP 1310/34]
MSDRPSSSYTEHFHLPHTPFLCYYCTSSITLVCPPPASAFVDACVVDVVTLASAFVDACLVNVVTLAAAFVICLS